MALPFDHDLKRRPINPMVSEHKTESGKTLLIFGNYGEQYMSSCAFHYPKLGHAANFDVIKISCTKSENTKIPIILYREFDILYNGKTLHYSVLLYALI